MKEDKKKQKLFCLSGRKPSPRKCKGCRSLMTPADFAEMMEGIDEALAAVGAISRAVGDTAKEKGGNEA